MRDMDTDKQILHFWKIETAPKQNNFRMREYDTCLSTNSCDVAWKKVSRLKFFFAKPNFLCEIRGITHL